MAVVLLGALVTDVEAANIRIEWGITLTDALSGEVLTRALNENKDDRFALTLEVTEGLGNVSVEYAFCAFVTLTDEIGSYTVTFEAESERFGDAVSIGEVCAYLYGNGYGASPAIALAASAPPPTLTLACLPPPKGKSKENA